MAHEWVAPVAAGGAGAVGAFFTWLSGRQSRSQARTLARDDRRSTAYVDLVTHVEAVGLWAQTVRPSIDFGQHRGELPPINQQVRAVALMKAFASTAVDRLVDEWNDTVKAIEKADRMIGFALESMNLPSAGAGATGIDHSDVWMKLEEELRPAERKARDALEAAINREMNPD